MQQDTLRKYYFVSDLHMGGDGQLQHCDYIAEFIAFLSSDSSMDSTCSTGVPHQWQHAKDLPTPAEQNFKYVWLDLKHLKNFQRSRHCGDNLHGRQFPFASPEG
jgi:hypothetical protein